MSKPTIKSVLNRFSSSEYEVLSAVFESENFTGVIAKNQVAQCQSVLGEMNEVLLAFVQFACCYAEPPISGFHVGAAALGKSGAVYLGANMELAGLGLHNSIHAEQSALNNALLHAEQGVTHIAISATPCGHCRQFLNEMDSADNIQIILDAHGAIDLKELLPKSFGPPDLGIQEALFKPSSMTCVANERLSIELAKYVSMPCKVQSYAPYTAANSYVLVQSGDVSAVGVYVENAAYNPSLSPFISALDRLRFKVGHLDSLSRVMLFEMEDAKISHAETINSSLNIIAPEAEFSLVVC